MSRSMRSLALASLLSLSSAALATPPSLTGASVPVDISQSFFFVVNLRTLGVVGGTAPLNVTPGIVRLNNDAISTISVSAFPVEANNTVCLRFEDEGFTLPQSPFVLDVELTVTNTLNQTTGVQRVGIVQQAGAPVVNDDDPAAVQACFDPNATPVARAGVDQSLPDTDGKAGENVVLNGAQSSDGDGTISSYSWTLGDTQIATGPNPSVRLPDGVSQITLTVTDDSGDSTSSTSQDTVAITVVPTRAPVANAGASRSVPDSDKFAGERVRLDGSASSDPDGTLVSYEWFDGQQSSLGVGAVLASVFLPDGANQVTLVVRDNVGNTASAVVTITVGAPPARVALASLPNLSPNQRSMATTLDNLCLRLSERARQQSLETAQADLLSRCDGIIFDNTAARQIEALDALGAQDLNAIRTQALQFSRFQYVGVTDRLLALRGGARGTSVAGLTLDVDGRAIPLSGLREGIRYFLGNNSNGNSNSDGNGGGASADAEEPGGLLGDRWGLWARGNLTFGDKRATANDKGFDGDQWGLTAGVDYRLRDAWVLGAAVGAGAANISFNPSGRGGLDTKAWTVSLYGSTYVTSNFYLDGVVSYSVVDYDAERRIRYADGTGSIDRKALGATDGLNVSAGLSGGYDFVRGPWTFSPNAGFYYADSSVDAFRENGAGGLDLAYDENSFRSSTVNAGVRITYTWSGAWGVLMPHLRTEFVRELQDDVEVFGVRFANDPFASAANPTPPIVVRSDNADSSYWRIAAGVSAQFKYGLSGYVDYQRLEGFDALRIGDLTLGLRVQRSF